MKLKCHWAMSAINYKNNDRIAVCPRMQGTLASIDKNVIPSSFYNNEGFKALRKSLDSGTWPDTCTSCKSYEEINYKSYRQKANATRWTDNLLNYYNEETGEIDFKALEYIEVRFSNACNLSCLHCSPQWSSKWQSILKNVEPTKDDHKNEVHNILEPASNQSWTLDQVDKLTDDLIKNFPNLKHIDVGGGEPLYQKQFWRFLENMQSHPNLKNMTITCVSNFNTKVDYVKLSKLFLGFKESVIRISFDGGKKIYEYFRNGKYDNIIKNIQTFKINNSSTIIEGTNTISIYQILDIENIVNDLLEAPIDRIHHSFVQYPKYLSMAVVPKLKDLHAKTFEIEQKIDLINLSTTTEDKLKTKGKRRGVVKMLQEIRHVTKKSALDTNLQKQFVYYANRMDKIKNTSFKDVYGKTVEEIMYG